MEKEISQDFELQLKNIANYILQKLGDRINDKTNLYNIIAKNGQVYSLEEFENTVGQNPNTPSAYIFVANLWSSYEPRAYYPFISKFDLIIDAYLRKYYYSYKDKYYHPYGDYFKNLEYISIIVHFTKTNETFMEVANLETVAKNTNLSGLLQQYIELEKEGRVRLELNYDKNSHIWLSIRDPLEIEDVNGERFDEIFGEQRLFGGYDFFEASTIIWAYHKYGGGELVVKVIKDISNDYDILVKPYRIKLSPKKE
jgi:hypothetical protein